MSTTMMDCRVREEMAGAVLKEVAALEPTERLREADSLAQMVSQAVQNIEELWENLRQPLEGGVSLSETAGLARMLTRSANIIGMSLALLVAESPAQHQFKEATRTRLQRIKTQAASLRRLVDTPVPPADPERLRRSLEQMERGEGIEAEALAAELKE